MSFTGRRLVSTVCASLVVIACATSARGEASPADKAAAAALFSQGLHGGAQ